MGITEELSPTLDAARPHTVAFALRGREDGAVPEVEGDGDTVGTLRAADGGSSRDYIASAFNFEHGLAPHGSIAPSDTVATLTESEHKGHSAVHAGSAVRRLTPVECERLQGYRDNYTQIPWRGHAADECPDGPRYKALGNSMAIPVIVWIGQRIEAEERRRLAELAA
jgi:DNA (cytosine-5)-methyltransferase 1